MRASSWSGMLTKRYKGSTTSWTIGSRHSLAQKSQKVKDGMIARTKGDISQNEEWCLLRAEHVCDGETIVNYFVASFKSGGAGDCLDKIADSHKDYNITHWRYINKPKGVEE